MIDAPNNPSDFTKIAGTIVGSIIAAGGIAWNRYIAWRRKYKVDESSSVLDLSSLDSARKQLENQSNELQRIREDAAAAADAASKRIEAMQARMDSIQNQLDGEMDKRRNVEDTVSQLRAQLRALGAIPVV